MNSIWIKKTVAPLTAIVLALTLNGYAERVRVEEFWEDPTDIHADLMDGEVSPNAHKGERVNSPGTFDDDIDEDTQPEHILRSLSGLAYGAYSAGSGAGPDVQFNNLHGALGAGTLSNGFVDFSAHVSDIAIALNSPYNKDTASYIYTVFDAASTSVPAAIDLRPGLGGRFKIAVTNSIDANAQNPTPDIAQSIRFLIQTDGTDWWRSSAAFIPNTDFVRSAGEPATPENSFGDLNSDSITKATRESLMTTVLTDSLTWEAISDAAEADMNQMDDGTASGGITNDSLPLGSGGGGTINLANVTGFGIVPDVPTTGTIGGFGLPNSIAILGYVIEGEAPGGPGFLGARDWEIFE